jgi:hypothetical protein
MLFSPLLPCSCDTFTFKLQLWRYDNIDGSVNDIILKIFNISSVLQKINSILGSEYKVGSGGQSKSIVVQLYE